MAKHGIEGPTATKRSKKQRRHKVVEKSKKFTNTKQNSNIEIKDNQLEFEQEEEIAFDGEVDMTSMDDVEDVDVEVGDEDETQSSIVEKTSQPELPTTSKASIKAATTSSSNSTTPNTKKAKRRRESGTSSDEERWLTAIESGKLADVDDELKKMKDPRLMTARQRAMYERNLDKEPSPGGELLMSLPTGYREKEKPQTVEEIQKAALKSQKRKQLADEKREKDKKKTMDRLLKKQETKQRSTTRNKIVKTAQPMISYRNTSDGAFIQMPIDHVFPLQAQTARDPPKAQLCGITGCNNRKVYNCSKTNLPLCSFNCYRKNVDALRDIMC